MLILIRRSTCMRSYLHLYILVTYLKHNGMPPPDYRYFLFPLFYFLSVSFFYFSIPVSTLFLLLKRFSHLWLCPGQPGWRAAARSGREQQLCIQPAGRHGPRHSGGGRRLQQNWRPLTLAPTQLCHTSFSSLIILSVKWSCNFIFSSTFGRKLPSSLMVRLLISPMILR